MFIKKVRKSIYILQNESGANAVEFALIVPVLLFIIMGIIQFGIIFFYVVSTVHAANEGARWASLENPSGSTGTPGTTRYVVHNSSPWLELSDGDISIDPASPTIDNAGDPVTVSVTCTIPFLTGTDMQWTGTATHKIE